MPAQKKRPYVILRFLDKTQKGLAWLFSPTYRRLHQVKVQNAAILDQTKRILDWLQKPEASRAFFTHTKHKLRALEIHVTHRCNLHCVNCTHFCDLGYRDEINLDLVLKWLKLWSTRLEPQRFNICGGEPLLEKNLPAYINGVAEAFPKARRYLVSNGLLLHRWGGVLPELLGETNTDLYISEHPMNPRLRPIFDRNFKMAEQWAEQYSFRLNSRFYTAEGRDILPWWTHYHGSGRDIQPYADGRPEESQHYCSERGCVNLYQGKLWPCPRLAYLPLVIDKLTYKQDWEPYIQYKGLDFAASDAELEAFIQGVYGTEACGMCPKRRIAINSSNLSDGSPIKKLG